MAKINHRLWYSARTTVSHTVSHCR